MCTRPTAVRHVIPALQPSSHVPRQYCALALANRSKSPSSDTSKRAETSTGSTAYCPTCAASQHWKLICSYSCARSRRLRLCPANVQSLCTTKLSLQAAAAQLSRHALCCRSLARGSASSRATAGRTSRRRQKRQVTFAAVQDVYGTTTRGLLDQHYRIRVTWWVVDVYLQYCFEGFLVVACCEPHASRVILLMRRCCATS